jgi:hypothetical protein
MTEVSLMFLTRLTSNHNPPDLCPTQVACIADVLHHTWLQILLFFNQGPLDPVG